MSGGSALKDLLEAIGQAFSARKTRRSGLYQDLIATRFTALGEANNTFIVGLHEIDVALQALSEKAAEGANDQAAAVADLQAVLRRIGMTRAEGQTARRALYESARVIVRSDTLHLRDLLVTLSDEEQGAFRDFMAAVAEYFETNESYEHEFARVLLRVSDMAARAQRTGVDADDIALVRKTVGAAEDELLARWAAASSAFARLQFSLQLDMDVKARPEPLR